MFPTKNLPWKCLFCLKRKNGCNTTCVKKYIYVAKLLRSCYLFEILHTSTTIKTSKNVIKGKKRIFLKHSAMASLEMK